MADGSERKPQIKNDVQLRALAQPGRHACGGGLYVAVHPKKAGGFSKSFLVRFRVSVLTEQGRLTTKAREAGIGSYPDVTLGEARRKAAALRLNSKDCDPLEKRDEDRRAGLEAARAAAQEAERRVSFKDLAERYIANNSVGWKNDVHRRQWRNTLRSWVYPKIGARVVGEIDMAVVLEVLQQPVHEQDGAVNAFWEARPETASRVRQRMESILNYGRVLGLRSGDNPAAWATLKFALPKRSAVKAVKHHAALGIDELPAFMVDLKAREALSARALEFAILTAARTSEVLRARWREIDMVQALWIVPAERMKAKREHRVPLSKAALALLSKLQRGIGDAYVFAGEGGRGLSNMALLALVQGRMEKDVTVHGFRSVFRDYIGERTNFASDIAEAALAHKLGDATHEAYQRGDLLTKRVVMMQAWAEYCYSSGQTKNKGRR